MLALAGAPSPAPPAAPRPLRVVVVDNDVDALELAVTDLALEGHEIVGVATQGDEAIRLCRELRPDVLVTDQRMPPGPTGLAVAREVRRAVPDVRVVLHTNYRDERLELGAARAGAVLVRKGRLADLRAAVTGG